MGLHWQGNGHLSAVGAVPQQASPALRPQFVHPVESPIYKGKVWPGMVLTVKKDARL
jgi:hypothetical protein